MSSSTSPSNIYIEVNGSVRNRSTDILVDATYVDKYLADYDGTWRFVCDSRVLRESCEFFRTRLNPTWSMTDANAIGLAALERGSGNYRPITDIIDLKDEDASIVEVVLTFLHPPHRLNITTSTWREIIKLADKLGIGKLQELCKVYVDVVAVEEDPVSVLEWAWMTRSAAFFKASAENILHKGLFMTDATVKDLPAVLRLELLFKSLGYILQTFRFVTQGQEILFRPSCCGRTPGSTVAFRDQ